MRSHWAAQISALLLGVMLPMGRTQSPPPTGNSPITLDDAIRLAEANEPTFAAALAENRAVALERRDAKAALLPSVDFHNQYLFTQSNHTRSASTQGTSSQSLPVFIANNAVHEYTSQGTVNETVGWAGITAVKLADANAARAEAELEIARRGLVATVVELYYSVRSGTEKLAVSTRALEEANRFLDITEKRENAGEAAHADVLKARLGQQQRQRELADADVANEKAALELGVLLFPDPGTKYTVAEEPAPPPLPVLTDVEAAARTNNPEIRSALASLQAGQAETQKAWAGLTPDLALNYSYGIDAAQFASHGPDGVLNRGYSASATFDIPVWDWLTSERKVKEAHIRAEANKVALTAAQRRLLADLTEFYNEAAVAQKQLASLDASVTDARESLRLTTLRYTNGESTVLEVVDAQNTLVMAENAQADGMVRYHVALAQLGTLTGRL
jgi:outer membrane protein TolC